MLYQPNTLPENKPETTVKIMVPNLVHALKWDAKIHMVQTYTFRMEEKEIDKIITVRIITITIIINRDALRKEIDHRREIAQSNNRIDNRDRDAHRSRDAPSNNRIDSRNKEAHRSRDAPRDAHKEIAHRIDNRDVKLNKSNKLNKIIFLLYIYI